MSDVNFTIITGHAADKPTLRYTASGMQVANLRLGSNQRWKDKSGQYKERCEWFQVVVWGKIAEMITAQIDRGTKVLVQGQMQTRSWEDKDGQRKYTTELKADHIEVMGQPKSRPQNTDDDEIPEGNDDAVPF